MFAVGEGFADHFVGKGGGLRPVCPEESRYTGRANDFAFQAGFRFLNFCLGVSKALAGPMDLQFF